MGKTTLLAFVVLLAFGVVSAADACKDLPLYEGIVCSLGDSSTTAGLVLGWFPLVVAAVLVTVLIYGALYAIAHALNMRELEASSKHEIMQAFAMAIMVSFLVVMIGGASSFLGGLMSGTVQCGKDTMTISGIDSGIAYAKCNLGTKGQQIAELQAALASKAEFNNLNLYVSMLGVPVFSGMWMSNWYESVEAARFINTFATTSLIAINAQIFLLSYIQANMLPLFLPLGLVLRSFPPTRGMGALFMSLAIGFYFVFPFVFVVTDPGFVKLPKPETPAVPGSDFCYPTYSSAVAYVNYATPSSQGGAFMAATVSGLGTQFGKIYTGLLVHPLAALFITLMVIRYLIYLFGEEAYDITKLVTRVV